MTDHYKQADALKSLSLGESTPYPESYAPELLQAVPRSLNRDPLGISANQLPFHGQDSWTGYEISWLNSRGKPCIAIGLFELPASSPNLIESKSFKLYLNSFNQARIGELDELSALLQKDLSACAGAPVAVKLLSPAAFNQLAVTEWQGECLDTLDIGIDSFEFNPELLAGSVAANNPQEIEETLYSDLLKSNCLITNQPDWGSVMIKYRGPAINHEQLLRYLISYRTHNEFHEQCVERIFSDISHYCRPSKLTVYARYTRRGGLDINPFRSNFETEPKASRLARQ